MITLELELREKSALLVATKDQLNAIQKRIDANVQKAELYKAQKKSIYRLLVNRNELQRQYDCLHLAYRKLRKL